jgi:hypothetical protein
LVIALTFRGLTLRVRVISKLKELNEIRTFENPNQALAKEMSVRKGGSKPGAASFTN